MPHTRDFLSLLDLSSDEIPTLLDLAERLRADFLRGRLPRALENISVALIWDGGGFRNRVAFELGISRMGGTTIQVPGRLDEREPVEDVARYLDNWFDAIIVRTPDHAALQRLARAARAPVINARTSHNHPCEILGDLAFIRSVRGRLDNLKVAFVGEATNLGRSWFEAAARVPIQVVQVCPEGYEVSASFLAETGGAAVGTRAVTHALAAALRDADVVYTDIWPHGADDAARAQIGRQFRPYQITAERLALARPDVLFLPCPPVHRGEEVSEDAMISPHCRVYEAKDWLLHAQNALLLALLGKVPPA